jgi:CelD/BcsL family acetyltransferase involved in cellulose biosynthesis
MGSVDSVTVLQSWEELAAVRSFWERAANHPNTDYTLFTQVLRARPEVEAPHVVAVHEGSALRALVLCRIENSVCPLKLGYATVGQLRVRTLRVMHRGVIGDLDAEGADRVGEILLRALRTGGVRRLWVHAHLEDTPLVVAFRRRAGRRWRSWQRDRTPHWFIAIPSQPGGFLKQMKSKRRSWLRRMRADLEAQFPGTVRYATYRRPEELPHALADMETVARKTYQRGLGAGPRADAEHRYRFHAAATAGRLRLWVLYAGGQPRAFRLGQVYGDTIFGGGIGYDPEVASFRPGNLLLIHTLDELAQEGVKRYDLGLGDASYKQQFGQLQGYDVSFAVYAASPAPQAARLALGTAERLNAGMKRLADHLQWTKRIKRKWRSLVTPPDAEAN